MTVPIASVRLFQRAILLWVIGFTMSAYLGADALGTMGVSPLYVPPGPLAYITHALGMLPGRIGAAAVIVAVALLLLLCLRDLLLAPRWWSSLLIWVLYLDLMNRAWLAGSGGQQLVANLLFWNIFLHDAGRASGEPASLRTYVPFWILRCQLLLAYLATGLHKLTGSHWTDGTAMGIVATDPAFGPSWMAGHPVIASLATWAVLSFQLTFPIAAWYRPTRRAWMFFGVLFHAATALWMDVPEMGMAFIAAYAIWLDDDEVRRSGLLRRLAGVGRSPGPG